MKLAGEGSVIAAPELGIDGLQPITVLESDFRLWVQSSLSSVRRRGTDRRARGCESDAAPHDRPSFLIGPRVEPEDRFLRSRTGFGHTGGHTGADANVCDKKNAKQSDTAIRPKRRRARFEIVNAVTRGSIRVSATWTFARSGATRVADAVRLRAAVLPVMLADASTLQPPLA
jgi:hypothetical protein